MSFLHLEYWASQLLHPVIESGTMCLEDSVDHWALWLIYRTTSIIPVITLIQFYLSVTLYNHIQGYSQSHVGLQLLSTNNKVKLTLALLNLLCSDYKYILTFFVTHNTGRTNCLPIKNNYFLLSQDLNLHLRVGKKVVMLLTLLTPLDYINNFL